ncbi:MAG TPA: hypothetical protein VG735_03920 [Caulobacterales bacterium]|nr:hypothetical protein [Caulobacterales bacterium]
MNLVDPSGLEHGCTFASGDDVGVCGQRPEPVDLGWFNWFLEALEGWNDINLGSSLVGDAEAQTGGTQPQNNRCASAGQAPPPSTYAGFGQVERAMGAANPATGAGLGAVYLYEFHRGGVLDAQRYGGSPAYANYAFGVYMAASGASLSVTLSGANAYATCCSRYPPSVPMSPHYPSVPASNVANITQGYNDQRNGTTCRVR